MGQNPGCLRIVRNFGTDAGAIDKAREFQIGLDVPLGGALTLSTGAARSKATLVGGDDEKRTGFGITAKSELSKRTFLYTGLQLAKNYGVGNAETKMTLSLWMFSTKF